MRPLYTIKVEDQQTGRTETVLINQDYAGDATNVAEFVAFHLQCAVGILAARSIYDWDENTFFYYNGNAPDDVLCPKCYVSALGCAWHTATKEETTAKRMRSEVEVVHPWERCFHGWFGDLFGYELTKTCAHCGVTFGAIPPAVIDPEQWFDGNDPDELDVPAAA